MPVLRLLRRLRSDHGPGPRALTAFTPHPHSPHSSSLLPAMPFADLESALDYLYRFTNYENMGRYDYSRTTFDLDRMRDMLSWCGDPDRRIPVLVHVAGTKGKGSACLFAAAILQAAGVRTGIYTSPHLEDLRERILVAGERIPPDALRGHLSDLEKYLEQPRDTLPPTFFDIFTTTALREFARQECGAAVVEVGLGGRLDSTNVIEPTVTAITTVDYDHMDKLGNELSQIAAEKAGILKSGVPVVVGPQSEPAAATISDRISALGIDAWWVGREIKIEGGTSASGVFEVVTPVRRHPGLKLRALGTHQRQNAAVAIGLCDRVAVQRGFSTGAGEELRVLSSLQLPGRIEVFRSDCPVVLDSAHNEVSARALAATIRESFQFQRLHLILGIAADKTVSGVLKHLVPPADVVYATAADSPRAMSPGELAAEVRKLGETSVVEGGKPAEALKQVLDAAGPEELVIIAGSFYLAGEMRPILRRMCEARN